MDFKLRVITLESGPNFKQKSRNIIYARLLKDKLRICFTQSAYINLFRVTQYPEKRSLSLETIENYIFSRFKEKIKRKIIPFAATDSRKLSRVVFIVYK